MVVTCGVGWGLGGSGLSAFSGDSSEAFNDSDLWGRGLGLGGGGSEALGTGGGKEALDSGVSEDWGPWLVE